MPAAQTPMTGVRAANRVRVRASRWIDDADSAHRAGYDAGRMKKRDRQMGPETIGCASCGAALPGDARFCPTCGAPQAALAATAQREPAPTPPARLMAPGTRLTEVYTVEEVVGEGGIGAELTFLFSPPVQITELFIDNVQDEERFRRNARVKGIEITTDERVREVIDAWAPDRGLESLIASARIEARKP